MYLHHNLHDLKAGALLPSAAAAAAAAAFTAFLQKPPLNAPRHGSVPFMQKSAHGYLDADSRR